MSDKQELLIFTNKDYYETTSMYELYTELFKNIIYRNPFSSFCSEELENILNTIYNNTIRDLELYNKIVYGSVLIDPLIYDKFDKFDFYPIKNICDDCRSGNKNIRHLFEWLDEMSEVLYEYIYEFEKFLNNARISSDRLFHCIETDKDSNWIIENLYYSLCTYVTTYISPSISINGINYSVYGVQQYIESLIYEWKLISEFSIEESSVIDDNFSMYGGYFK